MIKLINNLKHYVDIKVIIYYGSKSILFYVEFVLANITTNFAYLQNN